MNGPPLAASFPATRRRWPRARYLGASVAVLAALVAVAIVLASPPRATGPTPSEGKVLVPRGTIDNIPGGQFNAITLIANGTSVVSGSFTTTAGIIIYVMDPSQFESFVHSSTLAGGYNWTSGPYYNQTIDTFRIVVTSGPWDIVFVNPGLVFGTMIGYLSDVTLSQE